MLSKIMVLLVLLLSVGFNCVQAKELLIWVEDNHTNSRLSETNARADDNTSQWLKGSRLSSVYQQGRPFVLNQAMLKSLASGQGFYLSMTTKQRFWCQVNRVVLNANGSRSVFATITVDGQALPSVLTFSTKQFFARIVLPNGVYVLNALGDKGRMVDEQLLNEASQTEQQDYLYPPSEFKTPHQPHRPNDRPLDRGLEKQQRQQANAQVDVLFVYSLTADTLYGGDAQTRIHHLVAVNNQIYTDSNVLITMNAVAMVAIDYPDSHSPLDALKHMTYATDSTFSDIANLRTQYGADMVVLLRPSNSSVCGIAWVNGFNGSIATSSAFMHSHTSIDCADYVNAHETGHNLGLQHSRRQDNNGQTFDFALGHGVDSQFVTVMAYGSAFSANKVYKFSNAGLDCNGLPCGVDQSDSVNGADAVFALNAVRNEVANFYQATVADITPPQVTAPSGITLVTNDAAGVTATDGTISVFLNGATAIDAVDGNVVVSHDGPQIYPVGTTVVIFSATDSQGNMASASSTLTVVLVDTQAPVLSLPQSTTVVSHDQAGLAIDHSLVAAFLNEATALDNIDGTVMVAHDAPAIFSVGDNPVNFSAIDAAGNKAQANAILSVMYVDITPPVVTQTASVTQLRHTSASVVWQTDEQATARVQYGLSAQTLDQLASISDVNTVHSVSLQDLVPDTRYYYQVGNTDGSGNTSDDSAVLSFITVSLTADSDGDGMSDAFEWQYGLDPLDSSDAIEDLDQDGFSNIEELSFNTDPSDINSIPVIDSSWFQLLLKSAN